MTPDPPEIGSVWRHYKAGTFYRVVGLARRETDGSVLVLYQPQGAAYGFIPWARTLESWLGTPSQIHVTSGRAVNQLARFTLVQ